MNYTEHKRLLREYGLGRGDNASTADIIFNTISMYKRLTHNTNIVSSIMSSQRNFDTHTRLFLDDVLKMLLTNNKVNMMHYTILNPANSSCNTNSRGPNLEFTGKHNKVMGVPSKELIHLYKIYDARELALVVSILAEVCL